ncbi:MAG: hypothetical protein U9Q81_08745 [Pseudomonadota bacterium]|nr:hypothetical protein [Pseudomonadota bacterium]
MTLAECHAPGWVIGAAPRLGAGPVPAATLALVVDVFDLKHLQAGTLGRRQHQIDHQMAAIRAPGIGCRQGHTAGGAGLGVMGDLLVNRQTLRASMSGGARALPSATLLIRPVGLTRIGLGLCLGLHQILGPLGIIISIRGTGLLELVLRIPAGHVLPRLAGARRT